MKPFRPLQGYGGSEANVIAGKDIFPANAIVTFDRRGNPTVQEPKNDAPPGYRTNAKGNLEYVPGGPADPTIKNAPTELSGEKQRTLSLAYRAFAGNEGLNALAREGIFKPVSPIEQLFDFNKEGKVISIIARKPEDRRFIAAAQAFLQPILRLDSGAAVPVEELYNYMQTMLPQYTDDAAGLRDKAKRRDDTLKGLYGPISADYTTVYGPAKWTVLVPGTAPTGKGKAPSPAGGGASLPANAIALLREGFDTKFTNGQKWSLVNGKPQRIK
jgi:hypothetical protein